MTDEGSSCVFCLGGRVSVLQVSLWLYVCIYIYSILFFVYICFYLLLCPDHVFIVSRAPSSYKICKSSLLSLTTVIKIAKGPLTSELEIFDGDHLLECTIYEISPGTHLYCIVCQYVQKNAIVVQLPGLSILHIITLLKRCVCVCVTGWTILKQKQTWFPLTYPITSIKTSFDMMPGLLEPRLSKRNYQIPSWELTYLISPSKGTFEDDFPFPQVG